MYNKIIKAVMMLCLVALFIDLSHALKLPGGLGGKKSKKAAKAAIAYNLVAPEYDPALAAFGVIGAYDLGIAGAPVCLKVMECQINLALSNKFSTKAKGYFADAVANKETKAKLKALQDKMSSDDPKEQESATIEYKDLVDQVYSGSEEMDELNDEQKKLLLKGSGTAALNWKFLIDAGKDAAELPKLIKEGVDEVKDAIDNAKSSGIKGMKAVAGLTGNLKGIQGAAKLPGQFIDAAKLNKDVFSKIGAILKKNKVETPTIEEASTQDSEVEGPKRKGF